MAAHASSDAPDVVVVLSYFGLEDTLTCVASLVAGSPSATVLVIDNGSHDGVLEAVAQRWPAVEVLQLETNLGFAGGMNCGIQWALAAGARSITILNNDTIVPADAVRTLAEIATGGRVLVSPEVRYADRPDDIWFAGGVIDPETSLARHCSPREIAASPPDASGLRPSQVLAGCCLTASAATWRALHGFDERFFLNFEDSELSVRARELGIDLVVTTHVVIQHRVSASFSGSYSYLGSFYYTRNGLLFGALRHRWAVAQRMRFLRRHVLPVLGSDLRQRDWRSAARHSLIIGWAILAHLAHRYGRAPRALERLTEAWAADSKTRRRHA